MKVRRAKQYFIVNKEIVKDTDYNEDIVVFDNGFPFRAYVYKTNGAIKSQQYGEELKYIFTCLSDEPFYPTLIDGSIYYTDGKNGFQEGDRMCIYNFDEPDFVIKSIEFSGHLIMELEMIH